MTRSKRVVFALAAVGEADAQGQPAGANQRVLVFSTLEAHD